LFYNNVNGILLGGKDGDALMGCLLREEWDETISPGKNMVMSPNKNNPPLFLKQLSFTLYFFSPFTTSQL